MRRLVSIALIAVLAWFVEAAALGDWFRVTYTIDRSGPKEIRLIGRIFNTTSRDAANVQLRVQALDAAGNVLGEPGARSPHQRIPRRGRRVQIPHPGPVATRHAAGDALLGQLAPALLVLL